MKVIHLLRKPLSEKTVAVNTLKHGVGGLNIDATRIAWEKAGPNPSTRRREAAARSGAQGGAMGLRAAETEGVGALRDRSSLQAFTASRQGELVGRWPANLILHHLDECRCEGTKRVKGIAGGAHSGTKETHKQVGGFGHDRHNITRHNDEDGRETVANWICAEGCPVRSLDEQSGVLSSGVGAVKKMSSATNRGNQGAAYGAENRPEGTPMVSYGDKGGASRFFKQVGGKFDG